MMGAWLIVWSIRISLVCFVVAVAMLIAAPSTSNVRRWHRVFWSCGFLFFLLHVFSAFQFHHGWSNAAVVEDTRRQTREMLGVEFGGGVYFNYVFLLAWAFDLYWTLRSDASSHVG